MNDIFQKFLVAKPPDRHIWGDFYILFFHETVGREAEI